jgi:hypothetical protein
MGCDFDLVIQALHDSKWICIVKLVIGTCLGGYPLSDAMWTSQEDYGIRGTYGTDFPVADDGDYAVLWREAENEGAGDARNSSKEHSGNKLSEEEYFVYYSREEFENLAENCGSTINFRVMKQSREHAMALERVFGWLPLARSSLPIAVKQIKWSGFEDAHLIPDLLMRTTAIRKEKLVRMLLAVMKNSLLDKVLIELIADYALPWAADMRVAWKDSEGQSRDMRAGAEAPESTGEVLPVSCTMH